MLYIVGTPIGNLGDLSKRAIEALTNADLIYAEDTRTALNLLNALNIKNTIKSYYKDNEFKVYKEIVKKLEEGSNISIISEAGMPCISDPGHILVKEVIDLGLDYEIIQGPTALIHGLIASGFPTNHFYFHGFLPHKKNEKESEIENLKHILCPIIFYESPYRVKETLELLLKHFSCEISVTREATKKFEETVIIKSIEDIEKINIKGEFVIVLNNSSKDNEELNNTDSSSFNNINIPEIIKKLHNDNFSDKDILKVLKTLGIKRNEAYALIQKELPNK